MGQNLELGIKLKFDGKEVEGGISVSREQLRGFKKELEDSVKPAEVLGQTIGKVGKLAAGAFTVGAVVGFADAVVQAGLAAEKLNRQLAFSAGSTAAAAQELAYLRKTTNDLGLDFATAAAAYGKLAAASKGTALQGQETRNVFESIAKASTVMGLSAGETEGALLAVQQMISKGTVSAEELRGQLGERLPGAFQIAARAMGVTTAELGKMLEQGQVATSEFLPRFAAELTKTLGDAPQSAAASAQASINRMTSAWEDFKASLANSGVLDAAANSVRVLAAGLNSVNSSELAKVARLQAEIANLELVRNGQRASGEDDFYTNKRIVELRREIIAIQDKGRAEREAGQAAAERRASADRAAQNDLDREMQRGRQTDPDRLAAMQTSAEAALKAWGDSKHGTKNEEKFRKLRELTHEYSAAYQAAIKLGKSEDELAQINIDYRKRVAELDKDTVKSITIVDAAVEANKDYAKAIESLTGIEAKATGAAKDLTAAEQVRENLIVSGAWDKLAPATREVVDAYVAAANAALAAAAAEKEWSDAAKRAQQDTDRRIDSLATQATAAEREVANYGLTAGAIERSIIKRLEERRTIEAGLDGHESMVEALDREIAARKRLAAAADSKDALDANKKATEEMQRDWERMHDQLSQSLTDELMRGGQNAGELLENYFKTLVLRPIIQGVVSIGMNAAAGALGLNAGNAAGGAGGALNLLSNGSSIYSALSGGGGMLAGAVNTGAYMTAGNMGFSQAAMLAAQDSVFGAAGTAATLEAAGATASATSALSGLATVAPWIAGGIAVASIFGDMFGSKKPAPIEWALLNRPENFNLGGAGGKYWDQYSAESPFGEVTAIGQHLKRNDQSAESLKSRIADPIAALDKVLAEHMTTAEIAAAAKAVQYKAEVEHGFTQGEISGVMMQRLNRISNSIGGWVDTLFDTTAGKVQERYADLAQLLAIRGDEVLERLAQDMLSATGKFSSKKFSALAGGVEQYKSLFYSETEKFDDASARVRKVLADLNVAFPESREGFRALVDGIDTSTKAGWDQYGSLIALSPAMDAYYKSLENELGIKGRLAAMNENYFATLTDFVRARSYVANGIPLSAANMPSYDVGTDYVPVTGPALLHKGEAVLTAAENRMSGQAVVELRALRQLMGKLNSAIESIDRSSRKTSDTLVRVTRDGDSLLTEAA